MADDRAGARSRRSERLVLSSWPGAVGAERATKVYAHSVVGEPLPAAGDAAQERMAVIRTFGDTKPLIAMLNAGHPVLAVLRTSDEERRRVLDFLGGWALGAGGELDKIGPNTILARPPGCGAVHLSRLSFVSAVEEVFASDDPHPLTREEEERLLPLALVGSAGARRRLIDAYSEFATVFALRIRPQSVSEGTAIRAAQQELERLVSFPSHGPLLASLAQGISKILLG